jgi:CubicO group peptidase (beta-lactamase class C family)
MGSYWNDKFDSTWHSLRTVKDFIPLFADDPLAFEPGEKWQYSNAGFIVLGAIIEHVTQQSYFDYVKEHIYEPAGMFNTDAYELDQSTPNLALGYTKVGLDNPEPGEWRNNLLLHVVKGGPAGGGFSTIEDLLNFSIALRSYKLLSEEYTNIVLDGKVDRAHSGTERTMYGYGFGDDTTNGTRIVGHTGGAPGINGQFDMYLDLGYTVVVLSNYDSPAAGQVARWLRQKLTHDEV